MLLQSFWFCGGYWFDWVHWFWFVWGDRVFFRDRGGYGNWLAGRCIEVSIVHLNIFDGKHSISEAKTFSRCLTFLHEIKNKELNNYKESTGSKLSKSN